MTSKIFHDINRIILLIIAMHIMAQNIHAKIITGSVLSNDGFPLVGVKLKVEYPRIDTITNDRGGFSIEIGEKFLKEKCCVIRFALPGYKTKTVVMDVGKNAYNIIMDKGEDKIFPNICRNNNDKLKRLGWELKITLPNNSKIEYKYINDIDNSRILVKYHFELMELGIGQLWSSGMPDKEILSGQITREKEMPLGAGMDYGGTAPNGKKWRYIDFMTQTISYIDVSKSTAEIFDKIIDSMCIDLNEIINADTRQKLENIIK